MKDQYNAMPVLRAFDVQVAGSQKIMRCGCEVLKLERCIGLRGWLMSPSAAGDGGRLFVVTIDSLLLVSSPKRCMSVASPQMYLQDLSSQAIFVVAKRMGMCMLEGLGDLLEVEQLVRC